MVLTKLHEFKKSRYKHSEYYHKNPERHGIWSAKKKICCFDLYLSTGKKPHEHVNNEDMDKAITAFRQALLYNDRHYNAWYGLGSIYYRQENYELSEYHFQQARSINARCSILDCYLGKFLCVHSY